MEESKMVLRTEDLVKKYGKRTVVSHVSINVKQGEIVGLLGPNGAGKTTSFYMTVGLITPNEADRYRLFGTGGFRVSSDECGRQYCFCIGNDGSSFGVSERKVGKLDCGVPLAEGA